jgi:hypothetical protein
MAFATISVCGLDYSFTVELGSLGVSCLVSAPSSFRRLGSRLPSARPPDASHRKVELEDIHKVVKIKRNQGKAQEIQPHDKEDAQSQNGRCKPNI